jgi:hypothetical protein
MTKTVFSAGELGLRLMKTESRAKTLLFKKDCTSLTRATSPTAKGPLYGNRQSMDVEEDIWCVDCQRMGDGDWERELGT